LDARPTAVLLSGLPHRACKAHFTLRYFPTPTACATRQRAGDSCARRLLAAASVDRRRTVMRPLHTLRSASDADDNPTTLCASPIARSTELGRSVSLLGTWLPGVDRHVDFVEHAANRRQNFARGLIHFRLERYTPATGFWGRDIDRKRRAVSFRMFIRVLSYFT